MVQLFALRLRKLIGRAAQRLAAQPLGRFRYVDTILAGNL
jgi:hypothetical protein